MHCARASPGSGDPAPTSLRPSGTSAPPQRTAAARRVSPSFYPSPMAEIARGTPRPHDTIGAMPRAHWPLGVLGVTVAVTAAVLLAAVPTVSRRAASVARAGRRDGRRVCHSTVRDRVRRRWPSRSPATRYSSRPGTYREALRTTRGGTPGAPLTVRAARPDSAPRVRGFGARGHDRSSPRRARRPHPRWDVRRRRCRAGDQRGVGARPAPSRGPAVEPRLRRHGRAQPMCSSNASSFTTASTRRAAARTPTAS